MELDQSLIACELKIRAWCQRNIYCLRNIISNVTNNKNDFQLITITPTIFFKNHNCNTFQSFQVFPSLPSFVFVVLFVHFFFLLKSYFFPLSLVAIPIRIESDKFLRETASNKRKMVEKQ